MQNNLRLHGLALAFYAGLAFLLLHDIIFNTGTRVAGYDFFNYNWNFWWTRHALTTPGLSLYENNFVMFPAISNYGYHALTLFWFPLWALLEPFIGTLAAVNVIIFIGCTLNGYLLFLLLRSEGVHPGFALLAGAVLQTLPISRYFYYNTHLNLMDWFWIPIHLLLWQQIIKATVARHYRRGAVWAITMGIGLWALLHTDLQFPIFTAFLLAPYGLLTVWQQRHKFIPLAALSALTVTVALLLMWFLGPLPYILEFTGNLTPSPVEDRPGIAFPEGLFTMSSTWWEWFSPTTGAFFTLSLLAALAFSLWRKSDLKWRPVRWFWLLLALPPLLMALGPNIPIFGVDTPGPFRLLYDLTDGNFRMPWRLAPVAVIAGMLFVGLTFSPWLRRLTRPARTFGLVAAFLLLAFTVRLYESGPLQAMLPEYDFYNAMAADGYDDYIVVEAPTGLGTGELLLGDMWAIQYQYYGVLHHKRMVNGFISRTSIDNYFYIETGDPMLSWLGQRVRLDPERVEAQLRQRVNDWPIGYIVLHTDRIDPFGNTMQEILGYFNTLPDLLCPPFSESKNGRTAVVYRTAWHPDGCALRTPTQTTDGAYVIDIGAPQDAQHIGWGYHPREDVAGINLRWTGDYPQTQTYLDLPPDDYTLQIAMQAFWEPRQVEILVNGTSLGAPVTVVTDTLQTYTFDLPADAIGSGQHLTLTLNYDAALIPVDVGQSADQRALAVALDWLRFTPAE